MAELTEADVVVDFRTPDTDVVLPFLDPRVAAPLIRHDWPYEIWSASPQATGLIAWWPFGPPGGTVVGELINSQDGTLTNMDPSTDWETDVELGGHILDFDGVDDRVVSTNNSLFDLTEAVTLSAWVRPTSDNCVLCKQGTSIAYDITVEANLATFRIGGFVIVNGPNVVSDGLWHHIVGTYDRVTARLYVDGVAFQTQASTTAIPVNTFKIVIGGIDFDPAPFVIPAKITDCRIYSEALSPTIIAEMFAPVTRWDLYKD